MKIFRNLLIHVILVSGLLALDNLVVQQNSDEVAEILKIQQKYTKILKSYEYGTTKYRHKIDLLKQTFLDEYATVVHEIADGHGLWIEFTSGHHAILHDAPSGSKGGSGGVIRSQIDLNEQLTVFKRAAKRSGNTKVLAIAAQYWDWGYNDDVPILATMLQEAGFDVTYKRYDSRQAGSVEDFKNWHEYGIVLISTHGQVKSERSRREGSVNVIIDLNVAPSSVSDEEIRSNKFILWHNCDDEHNCHDSLMASNLFFEQELETLPNTLVYMSACYVGKHDAMAEVLFNKGAKTMIGYSNLVQVSFAEEQGVSIFKRIIEHESIEEIFEIPKNTHLAEGFHTGIKEVDDSPAEVVVYQKDAVNYENYLLNKSYYISGSFTHHDFEGVDDAFDWAFTATNGTVFQLKGKTATDSDVFGWLKVEAEINSSPDWYMFALGSDVDSDGSEKFDWILVSTNVDRKAVYKLDGVSDEGTFKYSEKIDINYTIEHNKVQFLNQ